MLFLPEAPQIYWDIIALIMAVTASIIKKVINNIDN